MASENRYRTPTHSQFHRKPRWYWLLVPTVCLAGGSFAGCHDGPLYALKHTNPYFTMQQWKSDEQIGVTDHRRREELISLAESMPTLPQDRQQYWSNHLTEIYNNDESAEMRRLAVLAAGKSSDGAMMGLIEKALDDENLKVRMESCRALGNRQDEQAARLLAATVGKSQDKDVRHAAIAALAQHSGPIAADSLKLALKDRNPATQALVIGSLRQSTGKDYGNDPETWIAALEGKDVPSQPSRGTGLGSFF
ncbi:HEAT repeat domain-containing protein [Neorhodopirellula pilleata]|uniref:HEAT repeat protein n=1 Tax=Neorhodopirellula pilleata TaxID=2714738 RepID=A0A5C6B0L8_9BACT|nr:HEAT repeat domain-containing protein [Neorhodopirellula pilleata]TWU03964.1 hypothetical protein Pla100_09000 [Neorhodopirellula pilleata]